MIRAISAQIALFTFVAAVCAGLYAQNPATTVLLRAIGAMLGAGLIGQFAAWTAKLVIREHLRTRKVKLDQEHLAALRKRNSDQVEIADADSTDVPPSTPAEVTT